MTSLLTSDIIYLSDNKNYLFFYQQMNFIKTTQQNIRHVLSERVQAYYKEQANEVAITLKQPKQLKETQQGTKNNSRNTQQNSQRGKNKSTSSHHLIIQSNGLHFHL
jgi:5'-3' exonuclease